MDIEQALKTIQENIEDNRVKDFLQPIKDKHFSVSLDTWKKNHLPEMIQAAAKTEETAEQKRVRELQEEIDRMKAETEKQKFESEVLAYGMSKGMPETLCRGLAIENIETARGLIDNLSGQIQTVIQERNVKAASGTAPKAGNTTPHTFSLERINEMTADEIYSNLNNLKE